MEEIIQRLEALEQKSRCMERQLRLWWGTAALLVTMGLLLLPHSGTAEDGGLPALQKRVAALESLLWHFRRSGNDVFITGANLHIVNGLGATNGRPDDPFDLN